ncbi:MAG: GGDEF domain-containing protein, partial [Sulfurimonas sp.]|nr:GGDEF domain-containing protein [Sulfurimonas sp.]
TIDSLTGAYNRRYLYSISEELIALTKREKRHLSVSMIDIDNFKKINDTYGHNIGDEVIKTVVNIIKRSKRDSDLSIRFGGEEFVILFPNTNIEQSTIVLEKIRQAIEQCNLINNVSFTVSIGVSEFIYNENNMEKAIKRADERLYIAKNSGKNKISK